jgi:uncharacterized repeat protein (TIGR03803 family)
LPPQLLWAAALVLTAFAAQAGVAFTALHVFTGNDGANPWAGLVQGSDGYLYGTTSGGGTNGGHGTVFKISTDGTFTSLYSFGDTSSSGANPEAALVQGTDGYFYGTTTGVSGTGTVFKMSTNGALTTLDSGGALAGTPGGLVEGSDGYFYGTTAHGGYGERFGTVFKISTSGVLTKLHIFTNGIDGAIPSSGLVQGPDGYFYGTTQGVSGSGAGTVFKMSTNGALTTLNSGGALAGTPSGLVEGSDGYFYGTTFSGGSEYFGTVFKISTSGVLTNLYIFTNGIDGANPSSGLVQGTDGYFYGTTDNPSRDDGTVFKISTNGTLTTLFSGFHNSAPIYALVQGTDGNFYGTTFSGGTNGNGTVFRLTSEKPQLTIVPYGANAILSWPANYTGYTLQSTANLFSPPVWTPVSTGPVVVGEQIVVITPISGTQQFFKLSR